MTDTNHLGQPIGFALPDWMPCPRPERTVLSGRYCVLEPLDVEKHAADLFAANLEDAEDRIWTYLGYGPFTTLEDYRTWADWAASGDDPLFFAILDASSKQALGVASFLRIAPEVGSIEVGHLCYSPRLQGTRAATEAMYLMLSHAIDTLGYRRYEWKCDNANEKSRRSAERLGFQFEGVFRQCTIYKGRNRDTAWLSILDTEWPSLKVAYERWLAPENFDDDGRQRVALSALTAEVRKTP